MISTTRLALCGVLGAIFTSAVSGAGDPARGAQVFSACAACHSIESGQHLTGPSLAKIVGRRAGSVEGFERYSKVLRKADVVWDEKTLDAWIANPEALIPGNLMTFPGIRNPEQRTDLIAFLKTPGKPQAVAMPRGGMGGMMGSPQLEDLKAVDPSQRVTSIRYCRGSYYVTTADAATTPFWEFNLRLKTDVSANGPLPGKPVLIGAGMRGDRAAVVFSTPREISASITERCE